MRNLPREQFGGMNRLVIRPYAEMGESVQEIRHEGPDVFTENVTEQQVSEAIRDQRNRTVIVHKPGSEVRVAGRDYVIDHHGSFRRKYPKAKNR